MAAYLLALSMTKGACNKGTWTRTVVPGNMLFLPSLVELFRRDKGGDETCSGSVALSDTFSE